MKKRIHVYPWHDQWLVEEMTDWQAFLNDLKLFGLRVSLLNLFDLLTKRYVPNNIVEFRR